MRIVSHLVLLLPLVVAGSVRADEVAGPVEFTPETREAVHRGLEYLRKTQRVDRVKRVDRTGPNGEALYEELGSWECNVGFKVNNTYQITTSNSRHPGVTALAGTAFLAGGHLPGRGPYGELLNRAVRYIVTVTDDKGFISENETRMYSHAFAALFLAEVYGSSLDRELNERVREKLDRSVQFILRAQNQQGGWRYEANAADSDMSVTVCQVMALRAARNKGIRVPQKAIDDAVRYVLDSAVTSGGSRWGNFGDGDMRPGAFKYQYRERNPIGTRVSLALTGAAMTTIFGAGLYDDRAIQAWAQSHGMARFAAGREKTPTIRDMAEYILSEYPGHAAQFGKHYFFFYGHYYACQAMYIAGGNAWHQYFPLVRTHLLRNQDSDGSWEVHQVGRTFGTAAACVILQVPLRFLPVLDQR